MRPSPKDIEEEAATLEGGLGRQWDGADVGPKAYSQGGSGRGCSPPAESAQLV